VQHAHLDENQKDKKESRQERKERQRKRQVVELVLRRGELAIPVRRRSS
jgi:hypothetical protein